MRLALISPPRRLNHLPLKAAQLDTKLGPMIAIADDDGLYLLEFIDKGGLENEVKNLSSKLKAAIISGETKIIKSIQVEVNNYFSGNNIRFNTPVHFVGSEFQKKVWTELMSIPPAETRSYWDMAQALHAPTASRAVARANSTNPLAIIVPCHRVINKNGDL